MRHNNEKKLVSILFVIILLVAVLPTTVSSQEPLRIIYVGGIGHGNYSDITTALKYAPNGSTIQIYPGIYNEKLIIDYSVTLQAANSTLGNVVVNGGGNGSIITILSPKVQIYELHLENSGPEFLRDFGIEILSHNVTIDRCHFNQMPCGIFIDSTYNVITKNFFTSNGILLNKTGFNIISSNQVNSKALVYLSDKEGMVFSNPSIGQLILNNCTNMTFSNQIFESTTCPIQMFYTNFCEFKNNEFSQNIIGLNSFNSSDNVFCENSFSSSSNYTAYIDSNSNNNHFYHNTFLDEQTVIIDNGFQTKWFNDLIFQGNHWADFDEHSEGAYDNNSDGIIDSAYDIPQSQNDDEYPLLNPYDAITNLDTSNNYLTIQQAIDDSLENHTIYVGAGIYHEQISIDTPITLLGERGKTKLDGENVDTLISIESDDVILNSLTIQNTWQLEAVGVSIVQNNCTIKNCDFNNNFYGLLVSSKNVQISDCSFNGNSYFGIKCEQAEKISLTTCVFNNNAQAGIYAIDSSNFSMDEISCLNNVGNGVWLDEVHNSLVKNSIFNQNDKSGFYCNNSQALDIFMNQFSNNYLHGIDIINSKNLSIHDNDILTNKDGIKCINVVDSYITKNVFSTNENSIYLSDQSCNNTITHNTFLLSVYKHAIDEGSNIWNESYPDGGNYWIRYSSDDEMRGAAQNETFFDGIYDEAYEIVGNGNKDFQPLVDPIGENKPIPVLDVTQQNDTVLVNATSSYDRDGQITGYTINFGDGHTSSEMVSIHKYNSNGTYKLRLTVTDDSTYSSTISIDINISSATNDTPPPTNTPPLRPPQPDGTISGRFNTLYNYTATTTDPNGDNIYYMFSWGDGTYSDWMGPYESGSSVTASHSFKKGYYSIRVKAKDTLDNESEWSDPLPISMPRGRNLFENFYVFIMDLLQRIFPFLFSFN